MTDECQALLINCLRHPHSEPWWWQHHVMKVLLSSRDSGSGEKLRGNGFSQIQKVNEQ